jgi:hypothetical protein
MQQRVKSLVTEANEHVPFASAASWAGLRDPSPRGARDTCLHCGEDALKVYPDHAFCFACRWWFTATRLLAAVWEVSEEDAAVRALERVNYIPLDYAHRWDAVDREPEPDRGLLEEALRTWCAANLPGWEQLQYRKDAARLHARCIELLDRVHTEADCKLWLSKCKVAMSQFCGPPG